MSNKGYIAVDLDGTLAEYDEWRGYNHIGKPIPAMVNRVKRWISEGKRVKIFTARIHNDGGQAKKPIENWLLENGLPLLEITCTKDMGMYELWDDRAVAVELNTGNYLSWRHGKSKEKQE